MLDTAVIPCGGRGTRLHPITRWLPKEMLPVGLKPVLYWTLDEAADAGLLRAIIVTNPHKPLLEAAARNYRGPARAGVRAAGPSRADWVTRSSEPAIIWPARRSWRCFPTTSSPDRIRARRWWRRFRATGRATVLLAEMSREAATSKGATGRATVRTDADGSLRVTDVADKGTGRFDTAGEAAAVTPIGRMAFPGDILEEFEEVGRELPAGVELDDVPVLQRLARRDALAGVISPAEFFDVGVPEGYRDAVAAFPARA